MKQKLIENMASDILGKSKKFKNHSSLANLMWINVLILSLAVLPFLGSFISKASADVLSYQFAKRMGGTGYESGNGVAYDSDGNVYTVGSFQNTVDFDPGAGTSNLVSAGSDDIFISKLDSSGTFVWAKSIGSTGTDAADEIVVDSSDNIYLTGNFTGTVDFDPGAGTSNLVTAGSNDIFVSKLDSSGTFVWAKGIGGAGNDNPNGINIDSSNNIYTTGFFSGTADFDPGVGTSNLVSAGGNDAFISKLDSSGTFVWAKGMGGAGSDAGAGITVDASGNVYSTGSFAGTADFDPGAGTSNLVSAGNGDVFVSKLDSSGTFVWAKGFGGTSSDYPATVVLDSSNNVYTTGAFNTTVDFDPGAGTSNLVSAGGGDIFISKLDSSGTFVWAKKLGSTGYDDSFDIAIDSSDNLYAVGAFEGTVDFDPGVGTSNITASGGNDVFIWKLDSSGTFLLAKTMGGTDYNYGYGIAVDDSENTYITGEFADVVDFDPGAGTSNLTSAGSSDIFVAKYSPVTAPTMAASSASLVNTTGATLTSNITDDGGDDATERGFQYGLDTSYGSTLSETGSFSTGSYSLELTGLTCGTEYFIRSYAENSGGTSTGTGTSFTTTQCSSSGSSGGGSSSSEDNIPATENPTTPDSQTCVGSSTTDSCVTQAEITAGAEITPSNGNGGNSSITENSPNTFETFLRNLGFGSIGEDVKRLQQFLNQNNFILATSSNGSPSNETTYYGSRTTNAITRFQEYYKDQILTPLGLSHGTGYFGDSTRSFVNSIIK